MNSNIIYLDFNKSQETDEIQTLTLAQPPAKRRNSWIRVDKEMAWIDTLMVFWLGAWTVIASIEFLHATATHLL